MFDRLPEAVGAMGAYRFSLKDGVRPLLCVHEYDWSSLLMVVIESNTLGKNMWSHEEESQSPNQFP